MSEEQQITPDDSTSDFIPEFILINARRNLIINRQMCSDIQSDE